MRDFDAQKYENKGIEVGFVIFRLVVIDFHRNVIPQASEEWRCHDNSAPTLCSRASVARMPSGSGSLSPSYSMPM